MPLTLWGLQTKMGLRIITSKRMDTPAGCFSAFFFDKGDNFCHFLFAFLYINYLLKSILPLKGKIFFSFRVDPLQMGAKPILTGLSLIMYSAFSRTCIAVLDQATSLVAHQVTV